MKTFKSLEIGESFWVVEDGYTMRYIKISETEARSELGVVTEFSPEYTVHGL